MADLKSVQFAMNGEAVGAAARRIGKDVSGLVPFDSKNPPKENKEWTIFKLVTTSNKGGVYLSSVDDVVNPESGQVERIRLLSGVKTIWQSEQKDLPKEYIERNLREIKFPRGTKILRVKNIDKTMIDFLRITNANVGNISRIAGARFEIYEYDSAMAEKEAFEKESQEIDMILLAKEAKSEDMRKHAAFLGIRMVTDLGEPKTDDGIRREYVIAAKRNPAYFKQTISSPQIEISWLVKKAIGESLIEVNREPGKIYWANGGGVICAIPQSENAQNYLTELAMTNSPDGLRFKEQLQKVAT